MRYKGRNLLSVFLSITINKVSNGFDIPEFEDNEVYEWKIISSKKVQEVLDYTFIHDNLLDI